MRLCHSHAARISSFLQASQRPLQASTTSTEPENAHKHRWTPGHSGHARQASRRARASLHSPQVTSAGHIASRRLAGRPRRNAKAPDFAALPASSQHRRTRLRTRSCNVQTLFWTLNPSKALFLEFHSRNSALIPKGHTKSRFDARHSSRRPSARRPLPSPRRDGYFSLRRDKRTSSSSRAFSPARSAQRNGACQGLEYTPSRYRAAERWCARIMFSGLFRQLAP